MWSASWIWKRQDQANPYNQTVIARRAFAAGAIQQAIMRITADSYYRLYINGAWVNDGPCRSWPEHYQFDEIDVTAFLEKGKNVIEVVARYFGTGTFHTRPQQAGLLAQLEINTASAETIQVGTDETWEIAIAPAYVANTPKISIQMEPQELYDARLESQLAFTPAAVLFSAGEGPWQDLRPRDVALLTRQPVALQSCLAANLVVRHEDMHFCFNTARLANPGVIEANHTVSQAGGLATLIHLKRPAELAVFSSGLSVFIDGKQSPDGNYALHRGQHLLLAFVSGWEVVGHNKVKELRIAGNPKSFRLENPVKPASPNAWCWLAFPEYGFVSDDLRWPAQGLLPEYEAKLKGFMDESDRLSREVVDLPSFMDQLGNRAQCLTAEDMLLEDHWWRFLHRQVSGLAGSLVEDPAALMVDSPTVTVIHPHPERDIELLYDLGQQDIGYYDFELVADAGVAVDIYGVEYITPEGVIQHSLGNRNGMRYITHKGLNRFTSTKRRSGRYLFVTLRNQKTPVRIRKLQLIESTYPVNATGSFRCSDTRLEKIWEISARTLKLCMEDTFTDCPLYEQTHWVGDARNESIYAYPVFGALDLGRRCIRLTAESLERYPIAGSQVPSCWDVLLPAWSFLWGISVWDYYEFSGDRAFVQEMWPWVLRNLQGAVKLRDRFGLFSGPFWNMFDWSGIDDAHETVLHNNMLMVGAVIAARKLAVVLGDEEHGGWLDTLQQELVHSINRFWDPVKRAYPDSLLADGSPSQVTSQHTSFLALLYDIIAPENVPDALKNMIDPSPVMVQVGSPFAMMYYYEALEKMGREDAILQSIYTSYLPMLEEDATTVWETFPSSAYRPGEFPTRSHCHAWSSAPLYFLDRIILGVKPVAPGGTVFEISPRLSGLVWAEGTLVTACGPLQVRWKAIGDHLQVKVRPPAGVQVQFKENDSLQGWKVEFTVA